MNDKSAQARQVIFAIVGIIVIAVCIYTDIYSELKFTEDTRNGVYERMVRDQGAH